MGCFTLFVLAVFGHTASAKTWGGYDYHRPMGRHHYPSGNHHHPPGNHNNFNYNTWCHSAGGWNGNNAWEDSNESSEENGHKSKPFRGGGWESSESSEGSSSEESQELNDGKDGVTRSTTTTRSVVINKTQTEPISSISIRQSSNDRPSPLEALLCLRVCPITSEYNPVCGTDDITYWNPGRLQCAISCGIDVALKRPSACPSDEQDTPEPTSSVATTLSPQVVATCMRSCPVTSEYNPVCGTDFLTYNNPSRLECAKSCGKPVSMLLSSRCPPPDQLTSTTTTATMTTLSPQVLATCMRSCPVTPEYNPVCGSDNITYNNPSTLECAKNCGKSVSILRPSRCPSPDDLTSTITTSTPASISSPMTPSSTPARASSPNPGPTPTAGSTTRFTIAQNILDEIFNGDNSSTESVPDFSLDERNE